jgi:TRAP-type C4-dicarboxylate transport system permease small subunit
MQRLTRFYETGALISFSLMTGCVLWQVLARNVIHFPTPQVEELSRFLFVWSVFLGAATAWSRNAHIVINILSRRLKGLTKQILQLFNHALSAIFIFCVWLGTIYCMIEQFEATTSALEISISWFYLGLFIGVTGILIFHIHLVIKISRGIDESTPITFS